MKSTRSLIPYIYCSPHLRGRPIFSSVSRAYKTYGGGRGSKVSVRFFQNLKIKRQFYFSKILILLLFLCVLFRGWGEEGRGGRRFTKRVRFHCTLVKMIKKWTIPNRIHWGLGFRIPTTLSSWIPDSSPIVKLDVWWLFVLFEFRYLAFWAGHFWGENLFFLACHVKIKTKTEANQSKPIPHFTTIELCSSF